MNENEVTVNPVGYKVFKVNFLQTVSLDICFNNKGLISDNYEERLKDYLLGVFNLDLKSQPKNVNVSSFKLDAPSLQTYIAFEDESIHLLIGHKGYKSFDESLLPYINKLVLFLTNVAEQSDIEKIIYKKLNVWPVRLHDENGDRNSVLQTIIRPEHSKDMNVDISKGQKIFKEALSKIDDNGSLHLSLAYDRTNMKDELDRIELEISSTLKSIQVPELSERLKVVDQYMFDVYLNIVSEEIIKLMEEGI